MRKRVISISEASAAALFLALIIAGAYIAVPVGAVPVVLQNFFILLTALLLPTRLTVIVLLAYLIAGAFGLPVFAGGKGGLAHLMGPTAGYLLGYLPAAVVTSLLVHRFKLLSATVSRIIGTVVFIVLVYCCGIFWLMYISKLSFAKALAVGFFPFILFDLIKGLVAILISAIASSELNPALKK